MVSAILLGLCIGVSLGLTGAGGGILAVPALMFGLNMSLAEAAPVALIAVGAASAVGAVQGLRRGLVRYKAALLMAVTGGITAPLGLALARQIPAAWLSVGFAAIMLLVAVRMVRQSRPSSDRQTPVPERAKACHLSAETGRFIWTRRTAATLGSIGAASGICTGMLGVGGGFIIVPALTYFSDARMHSIVSTSLMVIALVSAATVGSALAHGLSLTEAQWLFVAAAISGMVIGRMASPHVPQTVLQRVFATVCVIVAGVLIWRA
ncbi:MAG: sulfite exporter TauE/SafE family protein [Achromobacter sp.]|uniref:sulfite exporter TauE/SafE family protein n=1 Tax=Achromobacter sp. TaxID=134375 RepID=UPI0012BDFD6A|nr:sulfite exporter TauE/SafE family protein [Achromobacter sp.]MPS82442.1 sulfite exporter TauE/SafE family protein [Achromobacter sp.]